MSVRDLETAVTQLSKDELAHFSKWFEEYVADARDRQIETDSLARRFDDAGKRAKADQNSGRCDKSVVSHDAFIAELKRDGVL